MSDNNTECHLGKSCPADPAVIFIDIELHIVAQLDRYPGALFYTEQLENGRRLDEKWRLVIT